MIKHISPRDLIDALSHHNAEGLHTMTTALILDGLPRTRPVDGLHGTFRVPAVYVEGGGSQEILEVPFVLSASAEVDITPAQVKTVRVSYFKQTRISPASAAIVVNSEVVIGFFDRGDGKIAVEVSTSLC